MASGGIVVHKKVQTEELLARRHFDSYSVCPKDLPVRKKYFYQFCDEGVLGTVGTCSQFLQADFESFL